MKISINTFLPNRMEWLAVRWIGRQLIHLWVGDMPLDRSITQLEMRINTTTFLSPCPRNADIITRALSKTRTITASFAALLNSIWIKTEPSLQMLTAMNISLRDTAPAYLVRGRLRSWSDQVAYIARLHIFVSSQHLPWPPIIRSRCNRQIFPGFFSWRVSVSFSVASFMPGVCWFQ